MLFYFAATSCLAQLDVRDGFDSPGLSKLWSTDRMAPGAFTIQSTIVRSGYSAAMIRLKAGDVFEAGKGKSRDSERDELREANNLVSTEGILYQYQFSLFLPDSFPILPTRLVIAQWKQYCPGGSCDDDNPVLAIRYVSGKLYVTLQTDSVASVVYQTTEEVRNKWLDFTFKTRFSKSDDGQVDAWLNEKQIVNYKGITGYSQKRGYPEKNHFFFKMGLYRDLIKEPMTIYMDEYSKKELKDR